MALLLELRHHAVECATFAVGMGQPFGFLGRFEQRVEVGRVGQGVGLTVREFVQVGVVHQGHPVVGVLRDTVRHVAEGLRVGVG